MLRSRTLSTFSPIHLLFVVLAVFVGLAAFPPTSQAQSEPGFGSVHFNFCTIYQQSPQTEDARSVATDEWNASNGSWESQTRLVQEFEGGTLDSLFVQELVDGTWTDTSRVGSEYDASNRLTLCTVKTSTDSGFENSLRTDLQYNSDGRLETVVSQIWNANNEDWTDFRRSTFQYNSDGNDTLEVVESWDVINQTWENFRRFERMYDAQNRLDLVRRDSWNGNTDTWESDVRIDVSYSSGSTVEIEDIWDGSSWNPDERRTTYLNSSSGLPDSTLTEDWDTAASDWVNDVRSTNSYTTHENTKKLERIVTEDWDANASEWNNTTRLRFSYTSIIPVELAQFKAQRTGEGAVQLTWQTASETNNSGFAVQRRVFDASAPGARQASPSTSWTTVQFIEGAGTTSEPKSYQFTDETVPYEAETARYRLKQVDLDGTTDLSKVVEVDLSAPDQLALRAPFPNPSQDQATVRYGLPEATEVQIAVYDLLGRRVATPVDGRKTAGRAEFQLQTQQLPSGTYILRLQTAEQTRTQRLTVVK
ncbi:MAG: T9SS type A sorting domain-containing protein [Salinibacter sp.]